MLRAGLFVSIVIVIFGIVKVIEEQLSKPKLLSLSLSSVRLRLRVRAAVCRPRCSSIK